jgi:hypothetical protein
MALMLLLLQVLLQGRPQEQQQGVPQGQQQ